MLESILLDIQACKRYRSGPLGPYIDGFVVIEQEQGFAHLTIYDHLRVVSAFNQWLARRRLGANKLDETQIDLFILWRRRRHQGRRSGRTTLIRLLAYLRELGAAHKLRPKRKQKRSSLGRILDEFAHHMSHKRGLAPATVKRDVCVVRCFLRAHYLKRRVELKTLQAKDIYSFFVDCSHRHGSCRASGMVSALRAFFRWALFRGLIKVDLAAAVPAVARWRLATIPKTLSPKQVRQLLNSCNRHTLKGHRDYALLLLIARLGVRASEVIHLRINDIDWRMGELTVRRKGGRMDRLPLPNDVGQAMASYLRRGRPTCAERRLFICMNAPYRALGHPSVVSSIVAAALRRANLTPPCRGAHLLRHTLATTLLQKGATLSEIGDLLGHRSSASTEIYAKVDLTALRTVTQPWPGASR